MLRSHRAARRSPDRETSDGDRKLLESYATLCTPSRILAAREEVARIEAAMDTLSPTQRDVLMLHFFVGLDHVAIAEQCDLSAVAVRTHLHRGIARLTAEIDRRRGPAA